jgi:EAL domain-containing protein (putative c-di-GMP-specific phosphodiesterase class I)
MRESSLKPRIVVVDDDPLILGFLRHLLQQLGFEQVLTFTAARDAMVQLADHRGESEVLLCDLDMPDIDGIELIRYLGSIGYAGSVVLVSGQDIRVLQTAEKLALAHRLRVLGVLPKPVTRQALSQVLDFRDAAVMPGYNPGGEYPYPPEELARAIASGELVNHYQPVIDLATGDVTGVETLVRWQHPRDGLVLPDSFIPLAEDNDLIDDLTRFVLGSALAQARSWTEQDFRLHVAINLSMNSLASLEFPDFVQRVAREQQVPLSRLVLEVTESRLMKNRLAALDVLTRLRLKHVALSIDDFGTGHSSLVQLRDVPFDQLKIDHSFVHGAWHDNSLRAIFEGSMSMARQLGMVTVAEGVEDEQDWHFVRAAKCQLAQGYFIARPMPGDQLPGWIDRWHQRRTGLLAD